MRHSEEQPLLNALLTGDELAQFRANSLQHALAALRRRKRRAQIIQYGLLTAVPILAVVLAVAWWESPDTGTVGATATGTLIQQAAPRAEPGPPTVKCIDDEELFALFPKRSLALVGPPGHQQLIFLDDLVSN